MGNQQIKVPLPDHDTNKSLGNAIDPLVQRLVKSFLACLFLLKEEQCFVLVTSVVNRVKVTPELG